MRLFIAVNFNEEVKDYLASLQESVKKISTSGNFSLRENLHLTIVFLGEHEPSEVSKIKQAIESVKAPAFELTIGGVGRFSRDGCSIVWAGVRKNEVLSSIHESLCKSLKNLGFSIESRKFTPHLTLARKMALTGDLNTVNAPDIKTKVRRISLMKSERINGKLTYTEIYGMDLADSSI